MLWIKYHQLVIYSLLMYLSVFIYCLFINFIIKGFEDVVCIRRNQSVSNAQEYAILAILENKNQSDEIYRHVDCMLIVKYDNICENYQKVYKIMQ